MVVLTTCSFAANLTYVRVDEPIVEGRLALKPVDQAARLTMLHNQFLKAGCTADQIKEQPILGQDQPNLICTLPGTEPGSIVIGARSDYQSKGDELKVDWATLQTLPMLAESLVLTPHRYSLVFIAFTGHKDLAGSAAYIEELVGRRAQSHSRDDRSRPDRPHAGDLLVCHGAGGIRSDAPRTNQADHA